MSLWDSAGYAETYSADGCYVVRYEKGREVDWWGPYETERQCENAHLRLRRGCANSADVRKHRTTNPFIRVASSEETT